MQPLQLNGGVVVKRESSPLGYLELGISSNGGLRSVIKQEEDHIVFTAAQIQELCNQVAIFRYILSGLPVPIHLVIPIWNSVASTLGSVETGIYGHFPSLATVFGFGDLDYRSMMDPEPGRCRRTDGKKWRCYKDVVPHQKYCERHMHRGSQRSRKHVETSEDASKSNPSAIKSYNYSPSPISSIAASTYSGFTVAVSTSLDLTVPCSNSSECVPGSFKDGSSSYNGDSNWKSKGKSVVGDENGTTTNGSLVRVLADKNSTKYKSDYSCGQGVNNCNHIITSKMERSNLGNNKYSDASFAPGFGFSPKSVLQHDKAAVCTRLNLDCKTPEETEPLRCRRSDGRKWRCRRDVVPDKKYCEIHLCRGSKKAAFGSRTVMGAPVSIPRGSHPSFATPSKVENKIINLNTDLSISMAVSPRKISDGGDSSSFSSSDATTVTDENASISHNLTVSP